MSAAPVIGLTAIKLLVSELQGPWPDTGPRWPDIAIGHTKMPVRDHGGNQREKVATISIRHNKASRHATEMTTSLRTDDSFTESLHPAVGIR
jgi:hypothetical protein